MKIIRYLSIVSLVIILASCESKTFLRSKKKVEKDLQGHWRPIAGTSIYGTSVYDRNIHWVFESGQVTVVELDGSGNEKIIDQGLYSIDTKIDNYFINISDFSTRDYDTTYGFNINWTVIQLTGSILDIAGRPNNGGMVELEFQKTN